MFVSKKKYQKAVDEVHALNKKLLALNHNCFVTNERGHRVRYINASDAARAKAEGRG